MEVGRCGTTSEGCLNVVKPLFRNACRRVEDFLEAAGPAVRRVGLFEATSDFSRLRESDIEEGAALLALADAWDAMRSGRPYRPAKSPEGALAECAELMGAQFTPSAVAALIELHSTGELDRGDRLLPPDPLLPETRG